MKKIVCVLLLAPCLAFAADSPEVVELKKLNRTLAEIKDDIKEIKKGIMGDRFIIFGEGILQKLEKMEKHLGN